jgi:hypothetical protein
MTTKLVQSIALAVALSIGSILVNADDENGTNYGEYLLLSCTNVTVRASDVIAVYCHDMSITNGGEVWFFNQRDIDSVWCTDITGELVTNWTTVSITSPVISREEMCDLVFRSSSEHQEGEIISNTVAFINWHNKRVKTILESVIIDHVARDVPCMSDGRPLPKF